MRVQIEACGRTRAVEIRRSDGRFVVVLDGQVSIVDVSDAKGIWSLLVAVGSRETEEGMVSAPHSDGRRKAGVGVMGAARSYEVGFVEAPDGAMMVHVNGHAVAVSVSGRAARTTKSQHAGGASDTGPQSIIAPMPGKIVKVLVQRGDRVEARQGLIVVEAMKMENELRSRGAGIVADVRVTEGSSVEAGAILVVVE